MTRVEAGKVRIAKPMHPIGSQSAHAGGTPLHGPGACGPPVYRPAVGSLATSLQGKIEASRSRPKGASPQTAAPPVYRPQPKQGVQRMSSVKAPPVYRPGLKSSVQAKVSVPQLYRPLASVVTAPPVYRAAPVATRLATTLPKTILQQKPLGAPGVFRPQQDTVKAPPVYRPTQGIPSGNSWQNHSPHRYPVQARQAGAPHPGNAASSTAFPVRHIVQRMPSRTIQRLSINLQPDDFAVPTLVKLREGFGAPPEQAYLVEEIKGLEVKPTENIYLYGHGGTSEITRLKHDTMGRYNMVDLAKILAGITFPKNYSGTIHLIGCETQPLLLSLENALEKTIGFRPRIVGTTGDLRVLKNKSKNGKEEVLLVEVNKNQNSREIHFLIGILSEGFHWLEQLCRSRLSSVNALKDPLLNVKSCSEVLSQISKYEAQHRLNTIEEKLGQLTSTKDPLLVKKAQALEILKDQLEASCDMQKEIMGVLLQLLGDMEKSPNAPPNTGLVKQLIELLSKDMQDLANAIKENNQLVQSGRKASEKTPLFNVNQMVSRFYVDIDEKELNRMLEEVESGLDDVELDYAKILGKK